VKKNEKRISLSLHGKIVSSFSFCGIVEKNKNHILKNIVF
jgi:hypothetical protein